MHGCEGEDVEARQDGGHVQGAGVAELEAARARDGNEAVFHAEAAALVTSPPAAQTRPVEQLGIIVMLGVAIDFGFLDAAVVVVHKETANDARPSVHVFVVAPRCEVDVPIVKLEGHVSKSMCQIPAHCYAQTMAVSCDEFDVKELARVELDSREEHKGSRGVVLGDDGEDVFSCEVGRVGRGRSDGDEGRRGDVVVFKLRLCSVLMECELDDKHAVRKCELTWSLGKAFPSMMIL